MKTSFNFLCVFALLIAIVGSMVPVHTAYGADAAPSDSAKKPAETKEGESPKGDSEKGEDSGKNKKPADVTGGRFSGDPVYVRLPPLTLPILDQTGPEQLVTIQIVVEVKDFDTVDDMHANMPRIMDSLMKYLYGGLNQGSLRNGRLADITKVKSKALTALQSAMGYDKIKDILIVNMSQRLL